MIIHVFVQIVITNAKILHVLPHHASSVPFHASVVPRSFVSPVQKNVKFVVIIYVETVYAHAHQVEERENKTLLIINRKLAYIE